jgi:hypothetical protein
MNYFKSVRVSISTLIGPLASTCYSALIFAALFYVQMAEDFNDGKCKSGKWGASNRVRCHIWRLCMDYGGRQTIVRVWRLLPPNVHTYKKKYPLFQYSYRDEQWFPLPLPLHPTPLSPQLPYALTPLGYQPRLPSPYEIAEVHRKSKHL